MGYPRTFPPAPFIWEKGVWRCREYGCGIRLAPSLCPAVKKSSLGDEGYACQSKNALLRHISAITAYIIKGKYK